MKIKKGVIHIGASWGQEREEYGGLNVLWIEPLPHVFNQLTDNIKDLPNQKALKCLITHEDDKECEFYVSNQSPRSSVLKFTNHHFKDKSFSHTETLKIKSVRMDTLIDRLNINLSDYDGVVTDCQGSDYFVLKSFGSHLKHFSYIKSEVMTTEKYKGLKKEPEITDYLSSAGFSLISDNRYTPNGTQRDNVYQNEIL